MQIMAGRLDFLEKHGFVVKRGSVYRVSDERLQSGAILDRAVALITNTWPLGTWMRKRPSGSANCRKSWKGTHNDAPVRPRDSPISARAYHLSRCSSLGMARALKTEPNQ
jgi:hypothetical protein